MAKTKSAMTCLFLVAGDAEHDEEPRTPPLLEGGTAPPEVGKSSVERGTASGEQGGATSRENGKL